MNYQVFDEMYNTRDYKGVIIKTSVINLNGDIIFQGSVNEINNFLDTKCEPIWHNNKYCGTSYNNEEVVQTNISGNYAKHVFNKLNFKL